MSGGALCTLDELREKRTLGFDIDGHEIFIVLDGEHVYGYRDRCPHRGTPLAWKPDDYLDARGQHLICATHGALFEIDTGRCIAGPCAGAALEPVAVKVIGETVMVELPAGKP